ncbi:hypothetical protein Bca4012_051459 [Brassica carinata]|uniref:(rape) hypothetical protein n=1 Tax=Brassica napus TaxID=3708 RepID=A0A816KCJ9_BRANA|nr:unnamed protein product [Brassica napus]
MTREAQIHRWTQIVCSISNLNPRLQLSIPIQTNRPMDSTSPSRLNALDPTSSSPSFVNKMKPEVKRKTRFPYRSVSSK